MPRDLDLTWDIATGEFTFDRTVGNYVKRQETLFLNVTVVADGATTAAPTGMKSSLKPVNAPTNTLAQWSTFTQVGATNVYRASTTLNSSAIDTLLGATSDTWNCVFDMAGDGVTESDTLAVVLKTNQTRDNDTAPTALLNRNDFLVTNGTGLLVNVAAGYAANGAFVAAQASLAITNATNYIEVTAAGVASVNTTAFTAGSYPLATVVASAGAITSNTDLRAWITPKPSTSTGLTVGTTAIASGTTTRVLFDNAGVLGEYAISGTGSVAMTTSPSFTTPTIGDGTESAPSLSFTSDTNTGVYRPAADTVGIVGGGHDILRLTDVASAADYLEVKNGIGVGTPLHVLAEGASTNIGMHLQPKGSGLLTISDGTDFNKGIRFRSSSSAASAITLLDAVSTAGRVVTLPDATGTLALVSGDLGTPTVLVGTNITGTAASLTAGLVTSIGDLTGDVTSSNRATTLATVNSNVGSFTNASLTVNAKGLVTAASSGTAAVTSITGTANEIAVTGTTTPTLSLPSALTFTGKTVTGGTFSAPTLFEPQAVLYKILDNQDGTMQGRFTNDFKHVYLDSGGDVFLRSTDSFISYLTLAHFSASTGQMSLGMSAFLSGKIGFKNSTSTGTTTLASANVSATDYTATLPAATGTLALVSGNLGTPSAIVLTNASGTAASLTAGTVTTNANLTGHVTSVGNAAVLGSFTMAQLSAAVSDGDPAYVGAANTFTGTTNTFTLPTTTGTTTTSGIAIAGNSLTTGTGIYLASSTLTSGKALDIQVSGTAAAASQTALNVATAGANGTSGITSKGAVISNTHTGTTSTNVALELTASGGTTNVALNATAGHVLVPDGSYVYNTSVSPSIGRSAVAANSTSQAAILLGNNAVSILASSIRGFTLAGTSAFGNGTLVTGIGTSLTFATAVISTSVLQAGEDKTSTPNTGTVRGGGGSGSNIAGGELHIVGGASTGSAAGGSILLRTTPAGGAGSSGNAAVTALTIASTQAATFAGTLAVTGNTTLSGGLNLAPSAVKTTTYTITAADILTLVDMNTGAASFTVSLPASPSNGELHTIKNTATNVAYTLTIGRNGKNIEGAAADATVNGATLFSRTYQYQSTTASWWLTGSL